MGSYEILAPLGAGGMGEVYRARDTVLKREVALKVLLAALAHDPDRMARFQREAELLAVAPGSSATRAPRRMSSTESMFLSLHLSNGRSVDANLPILRGLQVGFR